MEYELFYLIGASQETEVEQIKSEVKDIVTAEGGEFLEKQVQEKRRLAYPVNHETHGIYVAQRFTLDDPEKTQTLTQKLNLHTKTLRFMISRADELPPLISSAERKEKSLEQVSRREAQVLQPVAKTAEEEKPVTEPKAKEKVKVSEEDLDRELEEILNI